MSNLKMSKNDIFYNEGLEQRIFMYWMLNHLKIDTENNNEDILKNMAKEFITNILGEDMVIESVDLFISCCSIRKNQEIDYSLEKIIDEADIILILNREIKEDRRYFIFNECHFFSNSFKNNTFENFSPEEEKMIELLKRYEKLNNDEIKKVKFVYCCEYIMGRYEKEAIEQKAILYDYEKFIQLFEKYKDKTDDTILDIYYNYLKIKNAKENRFRDTEVNSLYRMLERYLEVKYKEYDVYCSNYTNKIKCIKNKFFVEIYSEMFEKKENRRFIILKYFNPKKIYSNDIKIYQDKLGHIFREFELFEVVELEEKTKEVALLYLQINKNVSLIEIKDKIDEIIQKLEKLNELNDNTDVRNEYEEYYEMFYKRNNLHSKMKRRTRTQKICF